MKNLDELTQEIIAFRDARDWQQFHNSKDLAIALSIEASELLELFLWKDKEECNRERLKEELADVLIYALMLADKQQFDLAEIITEKIKKNAENYPIALSKGTVKKYRDR
ncbi:nucleotide pyrophosphohydrolase [Flavobacterium sp. JP2137]|uniref:nucleotide pyrophosphohydrolase n=1 Tax=Flavobacterium sp. JP2137 TaxID=3414510 RepID=UPI003D2FCA95